VTLDNGLVIAMSWAPAGPQQAWSTLEPVVEEPTRRVSGSGRVPRHASLRNHVGRLLAVTEYEIRALLEPTDPPHPAERNAFGDSPWRASRS